MKYSLKNLSVGSILFSTLVSYSTNVEANAPTPSLPSHMASQTLLTDVTKVNDKLFAVGERGHVIYSQDAESWQQANVPVNVLLTSIKFVTTNWVLSQATMPLY